MEPPSRPRIQFVNESELRLVYAPMRRGMEAALAKEGILEAEIVVLLTDDARITELNRDFRSLDEATDVLTFPAGDGASGDIAIAVPYAERQAKVRGIPLRIELAYLAIHGALHLCGYDDHTDAERDTMIRLMNEAAVATGLPSDEAWGSLLHDLPAEVGA